MYQWCVQVDRFFLLSRFLLRSRSRLVLDSRIIQNNCKLSTGVMKRLCNKCPALSEAEERRRSKGIVGSIVLLDQRHRKSLSKSRIFILDLVYRVSVDITGAKGQSIIVGVRFVSVLDFTVCISVGNLAAFPRRTI
jgi:hypothetical protein